MYVSILGRQPELSLAELEKTIGADNVIPLSDKAALINKKGGLNINHLGGTIKLGLVIKELGSEKKWDSLVNRLINHYMNKWSSSEAKITLGISYYGQGHSEKDIQKIGILIKQKLKKKNVSLRLVPNKELSLSSAVSHHNKLGLSDNKVELFIIQAEDGRILVAESIGSQNITAYAKRDQKRPRRDAFVGMLPPKLAQIMINLAIGDNNSDKSLRLLDPFCGTGVVLQEAAMMGLRVMGTDISQKMVDYSVENLEWLEKTHGLKIDKTLKLGDATTNKWQRPIDVVVSEVYLGQPFSAPPSGSKLNEVKNNCRQIIIKFLQNLDPQIDSGTKLCLAVPAWVNKNGALERLQITALLEKNGYRQHSFRSFEGPLIYKREKQIVARELLVLEKH